MTATLERIRVLSVDDHPLIREGIAALISAQTDMILVAEAATGRQAVDQFHLHRPDVTLMDLQMPDGGGMEALVAIRAQYEHARIVVLTTYQGDALAAQALRAGAQAYLLKSLLRKELLDTIRTVHKGQRHIAPEVATQLAEHVTDDRLTLRELEVLRLIAEGNSNKRIADALAIAEETVKGHVKTILSKLSANDRTHAVTIGVRRGLIRL